MNLKKLYELKKIGKKITFTCSSFDLLHAGHVVMLQEAASHGDYLIVGLLSNPLNDRLEKNSPIQSMFERWLQLQALGFIDMIIPFDNEKDLNDLLLTLHDIIDYRYVGEEYKDVEHTGKYIEGIEIIYNSRKHSFSSSSLRNRVCAQENKSIKAKG